MKKYKIRLQELEHSRESILYKLFTDEQLLKAKLKVKDYHFSSFEIDRSYKVCDCGKQATIGKHEVRSGRIVKEHWKCRECV